MAATGLLILTSPLPVLAGKLSGLLSSVAQHVGRTLYVHLDPGKSVLWPLTSQTALCQEHRSSCLKLIKSMYTDAHHICNSLDVRILLDNIKMTSAIEQRHLKDNFDIIITDCSHQASDLRSFINKKFLLKSDNIQIKLLSLDEMGKPSFQNNLVQISPEPDWMEYRNLVIGGTFDRIHNGHKIFLTEALMHCNNQLTVGVTDEKMISKKILSELIQPTSLRIQLIRDFIEEVDPAIKHFVVPISDPFGPAIEDHDLECILVSEETKKGAERVNEERRKKKMRQLNIEVIDVIEDRLSIRPEERKISSSTQRIKLLGSKLQPPLNKKRSKKLKPDLPKLPYVIGLTGGIASGKSSIASLLKTMGAYIIASDVVAHQTYFKGTAVYVKIVAEFGQEILKDDGEIDRKVLGTLVFGGTKEKLDKLNSIVWPEVQVQIQKQIAEAMNKGHKVVVAEIPLLIESGMNHQVHEIWVTVIPRNEALTRIQERAGLSEEQAETRINAQLPNESRVSQANVVFCTLWEPEFTKKQVEKAWADLQDYLKTFHEQ